MGYYHIIEAIEKLESQLASNNARLTKQEKEEQEQIKLEIAHLEQSLLYY